MQPTTLTLFAIALMVWTDDGAWWTRAAATISFLVCAVVDYRRVKRKQWQQAREF